MRPKSSPTPHPEILPLALKYLNFMANIKSCSPDTVRAYQSDLSQAFGFEAEFFSTREASDSIFRGRPGRFPDAELLTFCREALVRWVGLSSASRNRKVACLKSFLNWLHDEGVIERELAVHLHAPKIPVRLPHFISVDEVLSLLGSLENDLARALTSEDRAIVERDRALILVLYGGGLRVSEACELTWPNVEKEGRLLRITGKGSKERLVAVPSTVARALLRLRRRGDFAGDRVFGELSTRTAFEIVRSRGAKSGLVKPLHPHALRHSFATHLLSSGANLRTLQELLGHQSLQATQRYTHLGLDHLARTMEAFHPLGDGLGQSEGAGPIDTANDRLKKKA